MIQFTELTEEQQQELMVSASAFNQLKDIWLAEYSASLSGSAE